MRKIGVQKKIKNLFLILKRREDRRTNSLKKLINTLIEYARFIIILDISITYKIPYLRYIFVS